jgi:hypothetical protein
MHEIMRGRPRAVNDLLPSVISATLVDSGALAHQTSTGRLDSRLRQTNALITP